MSVNSIKKLLYFRESTDELDFPKYSWFGFTFLFYPDVFSSLGHFLHLPWNNSTLVFMHLRCSNVQFKNGKQNSWCNWLAFTAPCVPSAIDCNILISTCLGKKLSRDSFSVLLCFSHPLCHLFQTLAKVPLPCFYWHLVIRLQLFTTAVKKYKNICHFSLHTHRH